MRFLYLWGDSVSEGTGVRLYFSLGYSYGYYAGGSSSQLNLFHVRLPPNPSPNRPSPYAQQNGQQQGGQQYILRDLRSALQAKRGLFLAANDERVWFASAHQPPRGLPQHQQQPTQRAEVAMTVDLPGGTFAIAECPPKGDRREFVALNSSLAAVFAQQRPVDTLASLLEGGDRNELQAFASECVHDFRFRSRQVYSSAHSNSPEQSCALCLALACGGTSPQDVANAARRLFLDFGNSPSRQGASLRPLVERIVDEKTHRRLLRARWTTDVQSASRGLCHLSSSTAQNDMAAEGHSIIVRHALGLPLSDGVDVRAVRLERIRLDKIRLFLKRCSPLYNAT